MPRGRAGAPMRFQGLRGKFSLFIGQRDDGVALPDGNVNRSGKEAAGFLDEGHGVGFVECDEVDGTLRMDDDVF